MGPTLFAKVSMIEVLNAVAPVNADEFRKGLRIAQCMASWFEMMGLPMTRKHMDLWAAKLLEPVEAGEAPPFNGAQAAQVTTDFMQELWPELSPEEQESMGRAADAFNTQMVNHAPLEAQQAFAQLVAREWGQSL